METQDQDPTDHEQGIDPRKDVEQVLLTGEEQAEKLHQHDGLEEVRVGGNFLSRFAIFFIVERLTKLVVDVEDLAELENDKDDNDQLCDDLANDVPRDSWTIQLVVEVEHAALRCNVFVGRCGGQGVNRESTINVVDNEHLGNGQYIVASDTHAKEQGHSDHSHARKVEHVDASDVESGSATDVDCLSEKDDVVVYEDGVTGLLCNLCGSGSVSDANIGLCESRCIAGSIRNHCNLVAVSLQERNKIHLVVGGSSGTHQ